MSGPPWGGFEIAPANMPASEAGAVAILHRIDSGLEDVRLADARPTGTGPVFVTDSGWCFRVFDDCGGFDYIEAFAPPNGEWVEVEQAPEQSWVFWYRPRNDALWGWAVDGTSPSGYMA